MSRLRKAYSHTALVQSDVVAPKAVGSRRLQGKGARTSGITTMIGMVTESVKALIVTIELRCYTKRVKSDTPVVVQFRLNHLRHDLPLSQFEVFPLTN